MKLPQIFVIGSGIGFFLTATSVLARPTSTTTPVFEIPTFSRQALSPSLNTAEEWKTVAQNAFIAHDYVNSIAAYGKAIDLSKASDRPELLEERGWVLYRLGQFEKADQDLREAASLHLMHQKWNAYNNVRQMRKFVSNQAEY